MIEELIDNRDAPVVSGDRFLFVTLASARAKQLLRGAVPRLEVERPAKATSVALLEVFADRVDFALPGLPHGRGEPAARDRGVTVCGDGEVIPEAEGIARGGLALLVRHPDDMAWLHQVCVSARQRGESPAAALYSVLRSRLEESEFSYTWSTRALGVAAPTAASTALSTTRMKAAARAGVADMPASASGTGTGTGSASGSGPGHRLFPSPGRRRSGGGSRPGGADSPSIQPSDEEPPLEPVLGLLGSLWRSAGAEGAAALALVIALPHDGSNGVSLNLPKPAVTALPGSIALRLAASSTIKPAALIVALFRRRGVLTSQSAKIVHQQLRLSASMRKGIEDLTPLESLTVDDLSRATGLLVFVHGLISTDLGLFDSLIRRMRAAAPGVLLAGYPHNTFTGVGVNGLQLAEWLEKLLRPGDTENAAAGTPTDESALASAPSDAATTAAAAAAVVAALPVAFACHSRGGLVARAACVELFERDTRWKTRLRGCVTFGTPHEGAALAEVSDALLPIFAALAAWHGSGSTLSIADVLAYVGSGGAFEGIEDLRPLEGRGDTKDRFLTTLRQREGRAGRVDILAFGGRASIDGTAAKLVTHALSGVAHDHVVEFSSSAPRLFADGRRAETACNHFGYFAETPANGPHLTQAVQYLVRTLSATTPA